MQKLGVQMMTPAPIEATTNVHSHDGSNSSDRAKCTDDEMKSHSVFFLGGGLVRTTTTKDACEAYELDVKVHLK